MAETTSSLLTWTLIEYRDLLDLTKLATSSLTEVRNHLGDPQDYAPPSRQVLAKHTPLKPRQAALIELLKTF